MLWKLKIHPVKKTFVESSRFGLSDAVKEKNKGADITGFLEGRLEPINKKENSRIQSWCSLLSKN